MDTWAVFLKQEFDESRIFKEEQPLLTIEDVISFTLNNISIFVAVRSLCPQVWRSLMGAAIRMVEAREQLDRRCQSRSHPSDDQLLSGYPRSTRQ